MLTVSLGPTQDQSSQRMNQLQTTVVTNNQIRSDAHPLDDTIKAPSQENASPSLDRPLYYCCKRLLDLFIATLALGVLLPLMGIIAIAMKIESSGPILSLQEGVGVRRRRINGKCHWEQVRFTIYKFRTIQDSAETLFGHFLRRTNLNELPQLWNVLVGDMSLVGPRPALPAEVKTYSAWHLRRLEARPGMTGLWQLHKQCTPDFSEMVRLDINYIENQSFWLDLQILGNALSTIWQSQK